MILFTTVAGVRVDFDRLGKRFGRRAVLSGVSGALEPGRVIVVAGPNGSGKSTLLNLIAGLLRPSAGTLRYSHGERDLPRSEWFACLGVAAPDMAVYEELSAQENLRFFARLRGRSLDDAAAGAVLEGLGLAARDQKRQVGAYSSGMKQRVKLAQAIVHEPLVLLLDEPSSNLDAAGHTVVGEIVARFRTRAAVAIATNDPREMAWGDARIELGH